MTKKNIFFISLSLLLVIAVFLSYHIVTKPHRNIRKETASYEITSETLTNLFRNDQATANHKILDKTIIVSGTVTKMASSSLVRNYGVLASFERLKPFKKNTLVRVKGRCIGYDELLEEVRLEDCHLLTN